MAKRPYHHPNLKDSLLDAAVGLIGEVGVQAFTLREVARRAGVSHNAPYRHFEDKDDLLGAVAAQGFERLTAALLEAMEGGRTVVERLQRQGTGYVTFALRFPLHIQVMFEQPQRLDRPEYQAAARQAFDTLVDAVKAAQAEGGLPAGDPLPWAVVSWSAVHGLAKLAGGGRLPFTAEETIGFTGLLTTVTTIGMRNLPETQTLP